MGLHGRHDAAEYRDYDELWQSILGGVGPVGVHAVSLDESRRAALRGALFRQLGAPAGAFTLGARAWCAVGVV